MIPYGAASAASWVACYARRHMHDYGTTRTQLGAIAVNGRANAAANPKAIYTEPMTMDDYLAVRMVSEPLCLYDCDVPCDGSTAVVVSHRDYAPDAPAGAVGINAIGTAIRGRPSWDQFDDLTSMMMRHTAASMWERWAAPQPRSRHRDHPGADLRMALGHDAGPAVPGRGAHRSNGVGGHGAAGGAVARDPCGGHAAGLRRGLDLAGLHQLRDRAGQSHFCRCGHRGHAGGDLVGVFVAPLVTGWLIEHSGYPLMWLVAAASTVIGAAISIRIAKRF